MGWILDDTPFNQLASLTDLGFLGMCPPGELRICSTTAQAASRDRSGRRQGLLARTYDDRSPIVTIVTVVLDPTRTSQPH